MENSTFWLDLARGDLATWLQLTPYAYATIEGVHLVGVAFLFGSIFLLDLRLLGFMPRLVVESAVRFLLRVSVPAFATLAGSGVLLFVPSADRYVVSPIFLLKMAAIAMGGLNALAFHVLAQRRIGVRGAQALTPWSARTTAIVSLLVWVAVIVLGRSLGYERREPPGVEIELPWLLG
jgi:hypothetical protein